MSGEDASLEDQFRDAMSSQVLLRNVQKLAQKARAEWVRPIQELDMNRKLKLQKRMPKKNWRKQKQIRRRKRKQEEKEKKREDVSSPIVGSTISLTLTAEHVLESC